MNSIRRLSHEGLTGGQIKSHQVIKFENWIEIYTDGAPDSPSEVIHRQQRGTAWLLVLNNIVFAGVVALLGCADIVAGNTTNIESSSASFAVKTTLDQFPSHTEAERELEKILQGSDIDLALVSWLVAADIPEFKDMTGDAYFKQLDAMTDQVRQDIAKMQKVAVARGENLDSAKTRCAIFCNAIIKLRFAYTEEFRQENVTPAMMKALYAEPNNICLAGLLRTKRGSCVSMPVIYLVMGQRLGMPVHLVTIGKHYFIRWEETGYRMNIEPTIVEKVSVSPDDSVYLEIEGVTREQLSGSDLRNLTSREVVGNLLFARSGYWATKGQKYVLQQRRDLSLARQLAPDDQGIKKTYEAVFKNVGDKPKPAASESNSKGNAL